MRPAVCLNSGLDLANFRDHLRVTECQKPFEELAAILWIHKRSALMASYHLPSTDQLCRDLAGIYPEELSDVPLQVVGRRLKHLL